MKQIEKIILRELAIGVIYKRTQTKKVSMKY